MAYVDLATIQDTDPGDILTAAWCDQVRDNEEFLIDPPSCAVYASSSQSVSDNTPTALTANTERFDNDAMHSTSSNTSRITIQTAGRYTLSTVVRFAANATGIRLVEFYVNATDRHFVGQHISASGVSTTIISGSQPLTFAASDYVEVRANQTSGGSLDIDLLSFSAKLITR